MPIRHVQAGAKIGTPVVEPTAPGDFTFGETVIRTNGDQIEITIAYEPPNPIEGFIGFRPWLQSGDYLIAAEDNAAAAIPTDGTVGWIVGDAADASPLVPPVRAEPLPEVPYNPANKMLSILRPFPKKVETWIAYGVPESSRFTSQLRTLDMPEPHSPHVAFELSPRATHEDTRSGAEVAPLALTFTLRDPPDPLPDGAILISGVVYYPQGDGSYHWATTFDWTNPVSDPRYDQLGGYDVEIVAMLDPETEDPAGNFDLIAGRSKGDLEFKYEHATPSAYTVYRVYLRSYRGIDGVKNSRIHFTTPSVDIAVGRPDGNAGHEYAELVTGLTVTPRLPGDGYEYDGTGNITGYPLDIAWTVPDDPAYIGVVLGLIRGDLSDRAISGVEVGSSAFFDFFGFSAAPEVCILYALSSASDDAGAGKLNNYVLGVTPSVTFTVTPPNFHATGGPGEEVMGLVTGFVATIAYGVSMDGIEQYSFAGTWTLFTGNAAFGGLKIVARNVATGADTVLGYTGPGDTAFRSDLTAIDSPNITWDIYAVSTNHANGKENTLVPGTTPRTAGLTPTAQTTGKIKTYRFDPTTWNSTDFKITGGSLFEVKNIRSDKIEVGSWIKVGGGTGANAGPGQVAVYNGSNILRSWMGQNGSIYGGWFGELYVGGSSPADAPLYANNLGVVIVGGINSGFPFISVRNNVNVEVGRIGANIDSGFHGGWFKQLRVGGTLAAPVLQSDAAGNVTINGATFALSLNGVTTTLGNVYGGGSFPGANQYQGIRVLDPATLRSSAMTPSNVGVTASAVGGGPCATLYLKANGSGAAWFSGNGGISRIDIDSDPTGLFYLSVAGLVGGSLCKVLGGPDFMYSINAAGQTTWALGRNSGGGILRLFDGAGTQKLSADGSTGYLSCVALQVNGSFGTGGTIQVLKPGGGFYTFTINNGLITGIV